LKQQQEIRATLRHLYSAREGAIAACAPPRAGVVIEGDRKKIEDLRDENKQKVVILGRMIDSLQWVLGEPSELAEWVAAFEKMDRIEKMGFAGRVA
jgi:hypothetical protein